jgi:hypothetical protein
MPPLPSQTLKRSYHRLCPNFPPDLERRLREIVKNASISEIIRNYERVLGARASVINSKFFYKHIRNPDLLSLDGSDYFHVTSAIGEYVYGQFGIEALRKHFLTNDIMVTNLLDSNSWVFTMRCFSTLKGRGASPIYYSTKMPKVTVDGRLYCIGYTRHCLQRIHERLKQERYNYNALGECFSWAYETSYFEITQLNNGDPAAVIYTGCNTWWNHR